MREMIKRTKFWLEMWQEETIWEKQAGLDDNVRNDHQEMLYNTVAAVEDGNDLSGFLND